MDRRHKFIVSDKDKFIYYEIQKCATRTIRKYFLSNKEYGAKRISGMRSKSIPYENAGYFKFTFIRNPWDRVVSGWVSKFENYHDPNNPHQPGIRDPGLSLDTTFDEYVRFIHKIKDNRADCHFKSMHCFVPDDITIGRVENFDKDFNAILKVKNFTPYPITVENKSVGRGHYTDYYTPELRDLVAERYVVDIERYGYEF